MEVPQEPPRRQRGRSPQSITQRLSNDLNNVRLSNDIDNVSSNSHDSVNRPPRTSTSRSRVDTNMKADYDKIKGKLFQQQGRLNGEKLKVTQKKESCKKQINDLFAKLSDHKMVIYKFNSRNIWCSRRNRFFAKSIWKINL